MSSPTPMRRGPRGLGLISSQVHEPPDELTVLMELRLAFGPGTRLWAQRSREDLCYDWLRYKSRDPAPSFRRFALSLYEGEVCRSSGHGDLRGIRRRVAAVLRSHRIRRSPAASAQPLPVTLKAPDPGPKARGGVSGPGLSLGKEFPLASATVESQASLP
ncbi:MAG: hypothetical protein U0790_20780 [Isosphaeraceae bacterium]